MPLSSVLGASTLIKPGVVTSSTRPAVPYEGQLIFETDTDRIAAYNGSAWVTQNGLQLIKTQTIGTAVSSVTVSDVFSATYDNYLITISGGVASGNVDLKLTLGSTATGYYYALVYATYNSASAAAVVAQNTTSWAYTGSGSSDTLSFHVNVDNPFAAKRTVARAVLAQPYTTGAGGGFGGYLADNSSYTGFTITTSSGTMTGGTIRVYGYANN